jgi:hypothetical protein
MLNSAADLQVCDILLILYLNGMAIFVRTLFCLIKGRPSTITENERTALTMLEEKEKEYDQLLKEVEMHENYLLLICRYVTFFTCCETLVSLTGSTEIIL